MQKFTYCVGVNVPYDNEFVQRHEKFAKKLRKHFDVSLYFLTFSDDEKEFLKIRKNSKNFVINLRNWGGPVGLLDQFVELHENLLGDYVMITEADVFINSCRHFKNIVKILDENEDLFYVGHVYTDSQLYIPVEVNSKYPLYVKHIKNIIGFRGCKDFYSTDGGYHTFKREKLLEARKKLGVLPGYVNENDEDVPLDKESQINFRDRGPRILYHEVGFPTRMRFHGLKVGGITNHDKVVRPGREIRSRPSRRRKEEKS